MTGCIKVKELNKTGIYVSELDWDNCYQDKGNPKGNFVMIIEPLEGFDNGIIYYQKENDEYFIEGEGYVITGRKDIIEKRVKKWLSDYKQKKFEYKERQM